MAANDPFLQRAVAHVRNFAMDTLDAVRWSDADVVDLINNANALVHGEIVAATEPKTYMRFAEQDYTITASQEDYLFPGNMRRFLRMVEKDEDGRVVGEVPLTDYLSDLSGMVIMGRDRGFRITPRPLDTFQDKTLTLVYEAGVTPYLCYGTASAGATSTITLAAPTGSQLGTLSTENDFYNNSYIRTLSGTGAGQTRRITDFVGSTLVATVSPAWSTTPDNTTVFEIIPCLGPPLDMAIMWRACMAMKAADADMRHRASAREEYREIMREVLMQAADVQGRQGPTLSDDFLQHEDFGEIY